MSKDNSSDDSNKKASKKRAIPSRKTGNQPESRAIKAHANRARPARIPFTNNTKFNLPVWALEKYPANDYHFYYFTDNMIDQAEAAGYEFIKTDDGKRWSHPSKNSESTTERQILMALPMEYHLEDVAEKERKNRLLMAETETEIKGLQGAQAYKPEE